MILAAIFATPPGRDETGDPLPLAALMRYAYGDPACEFAFLFVFLRRTDDVRESTRFKKRLRG